MNLITTAAQDCSIYYGASFLSWERGKGKTNTSSSCTFPRMFITRSLHIVSHSTAQQDITRTQFQMCVPVRSDTWHWVNDRYIWGGLTLLGEASLPIFWMGRNTRLRQSPHNRASMSNWVSYGLTGTVIVGGITSIANVFTVLRKTPPVKGRTNS